jgi:hypothetical protein
VTVPAEQDQVAAFLGGLSGAAAKETHISAVFVGADTVWKLKKAVRLPFLDFTAVAVRRHFLERELALNQPAAPAIYRDVAFIGRRADGSLAVNNGEPVDWVLRMAPVPAGVPTRYLTVSVTALPPTMRDCRPSPDGTAPRPSLGLPQATRSPLWPPACRPSR